MEFLTTLEAAKLCRMSKRKFLELVRCGQAPAPLPGPQMSSYIFSRAQLVDWMMTGAIPTEAKLPWKKRGKGRPTKIEQRAARLG